MKSQVEFRFPAVVWSHKSFFFFWFLCRNIFGGRCDAAGISSSIKDWQRPRGWVIIKSQRRAMKSKDRKSWSILSVSSNVSSRTEEAPGGAQRGNSSYGVTQLHVINNTTKPQNKTCSTDSFNSSSSHFFATTLHCLQDEGNRRWGNKGRGKEKGNK